MNISPVHSDRYSDVYAEAVDAVANHGFADETELYEVVYLLAAVSPQVLRNIGEDEIADRLPDGETFVLSATLETGEVRRISLGEQAVRDFERLAEESPAQEGVYRNRVMVSGMKYASGIRYMHTTAEFTDGDKVTCSFGYCSPECRAEIVADDTARWEHSYDPARLPESYKPRLIRVTVEEEGLGVEIHPGQCYECDNCDRVSPACVDLYCTTHFETVEPGRSFCTQCGR